jgi:hypothetical protein
MNIKLSSSNFFKICNVSFSSDITMALVGVIGF